jgi:hypothetical protein
LQSLTTNTKIQFYEKTFLAAIVLLTMSASVQAQLVKFGFKGGLNYANYSGSDLQFDALTSYHAGLVAEIKLVDSFSIQPELLYSTQGATYKMQ